MTHLKAASERQPASLPHRLRTEIGAPGRPRGENVPLTCGFVRSG